MVARKFTVPFAAAGDLVDIPTDPQSDGGVSMTNGWGSDYEKPNDDPSYKPVGRGEMNRALHDPTEAIGEIQLYGFPLWGVWPGGYPIEACVSHGGKAWSSTVASNETEPGTEGAKWDEVITSTKLASALFDCIKLADFTGGNQYLDKAPAFQKLPGGLIMQMGHGGSSNGPTTSITFPLPFSLTLGVAIAGIQGTGNTHTNVTMNNFSNTGATFSCFQAASGVAPVLVQTTNTVQFRYIAVGKA